MTKKQKKMLWRIVITAVMLIALHFLPITGIAQLIAYLAAYAVIGYDILRKAGKGIARRVLPCHLDEERRLRRRHRRYAVLPDR